MAPAFHDDQHYIEGAHGTLADQNDEAFYDDRSDADDDLEKGRLKFPENKLYGRERELGVLCDIYGELAASIHEERGAEELGEEGEDLPTPSDPFLGSRVVFLSGYSGVGKTTLVKEFVKQIQNEYQLSDNHSPIILASGKYANKTTSSAPFSAIAEMIERLAMNLLSSGDEIEDGNGMNSKIERKVRESELIGPGTDGKIILQSIFTPLEPFLFSSDDTSKDGFTSSVQHSMNAIKVCTCEILSIIADALDYPLVLYLDDLQWGDEASIDLLSFLLSSTDLRNVMFFCAYRSNEVDADHSFTRLLKNVTSARDCGDLSTLQRVEGSFNSTSLSSMHPRCSVEKMDLYSFSLEVITKFIADSVKKEKEEEVSELAEAVYIKTMGNIFFVMQAVEELVRKNILFYDVMCFEWRWVVSKVELANYLSDDVVETVKGKINGLSANIRHLLTVMAHIPTTLDVPVLKVLMTYGTFSYSESSVRNLLKKASDESMLLFSSEAQNYIFAHDRIRQATLEISAEKDQDEMLLHISETLLGIARGLEMEWCLFVAVDLLNSLPLDKTTSVELIKLNLKVSKKARYRGSMVKENELLHKALTYFELSGIAWTEYGLTLELYNLLIVSEYRLGSFHKARAAMDAVFNNARSFDDKIQAYLYQISCKCDETSDYQKGIEDGCRVLALYGWEMPKSMTHAYMMREGMKVNLALHNHSYSCLLKLPMKDHPIFGIIAVVQKYARWTSNDKLVQILAWKAIRCALKRRISPRQLPSIIAGLAILLADQGKMRTAQELADVSLALSEKIRHDKENYALTRMLAYGCVVCRLQPFRDSIEPILQCHKDFKLGGGDVDFILGSMMVYFNLWVAAGLEVGSLFESKLRLVEGLCRKLDRLGFLTTFQIFRQFALNLRIRTGNPTEFRGEAFKEEEALIKMNSNARKMALRDSSSLRLQLAFVFGDEDAMSRMLKILSDYPVRDNQITRLHNRLCFTGLAAFSLGKKKGHDLFWQLGKNCLSHFEHLTKLGSVNAIPVYLFMLAMKGPSRETFNKAINACEVHNMAHLLAMAKERYAVFLKEEGDEALANDYITSSHLLYRDWGAGAKVLQLLQEHDVLSRG